VLLKLAYLTLCRTIHLLALRGRGRGAAKDLKGFARSGGILAAWR
jgi:hypothetical protein